MNLIDKLIQYNYYTLGLYGILYKKKLDFIPEVYLEMKDFFQYRLMQAETSLEKHSLLQVVCYLPFLMYQPYHFSIYAFISQSLEEKYKIFKFKLLD